MTLVTAPACTNPFCCVNLELKGNRISTLLRSTEIISAPIVDLKSYRRKLSLTFSSNASPLFPPVATSLVICHGSLAFVTAPSSTIQPGSRRHCGRCQLCPPHTRNQCHRRRAQTLCVPRGS